MPDSRKREEKMERTEKKYGIEYIGMQERINNPPLLMFNDLQTGTTFAVEHLRGLPEKMKEIKARFA